MHHKSNAGGFQHRLNDSISESGPGRGLPAPRRARPARLSSSRVRVQRSAATGRERPPPPPPSTHHHRRGGPHHHRRRRRRPAPQGILAKAIVQVMTRMGPGRLGPGRADSDRGRRSARAAARAVGVAGRRLAHSWAQCVSHGWRSWASRGYACNNYYN